MPCGEAGNIVPPLRVLRVLDEKVPRMVGTVVGVRGAETRMAWHIDALVQRVAGRLYPDKPLDMVEEFQVAPVRVMRGTRY